MRRVYSFLFYLALPLVMLRLWYRGRKAPAYRRRVAERLGQVPVQPQGTLWVHAVSVGETIAAVPLVRALQKRWPDLPVLVTTMTPTGSERVQALLGDAVQHSYAPYDAPHLVNRFLGRVNPRALVIMETELWPNMVTLTHRRGAPVFLVNARLSERSARGYSRVLPLVREMLQSLDWVAAQAQADADRFGKLGIPDSRIDVTGSIKFDLTIADAMRQQAADLRKRIGERPVWIAASTHRGEDAELLAAHRQVLRQYPGALLILVPRHPERFAEVWEEAGTLGVPIGRRSVDDDPAKLSVYLADTMGELLMLFGVADVAFIGGSLVDHGGHNPLEPAAWGMPVIMGPSNFNFADVCQRLTEGEGLCYVGSAPVLANRLFAFFDDPEHRTAIGRNAQAVVDANRGSLQRLVEGILSRMPDSP
ncbi:lipid IV(A) 3-deoxy-D-manno-octulosonic acid transferase [Marinobacteraceae bacterium S3BR75-40.1]